MNFINQNQDCFEAVIFHVCKRWDITPNFIYADSWQFDYASNDLLPYGKKLIVDFYRNIEVILYKIYGIKSI